MKKSLRAQFDLLKKDPRYGWRSEEFLAAEKRKLMLAIGADPDAPLRTYTWRDYLEFYRATLMPKMVRTFGTAMAGIALVFGGWLTTTHAASRSLPGDPLYGLKLITEQAQLRMSSLEQRAVLHTEFAERRLQEAVALQATGVATAQPDVLLAFAAFRQEINSANNDLQELRSTGNGAAAATAGIVEQRLNALDTVLDETVAVSNNTEVTTEVQVAKDASREVQSTAVSVIVDDHEAQQTEASQRELKEMFLREYGNVEARQQFDLHRIEVVRNAMTTQAERLAGQVLPTQADLDAIDAAVVGVGERIGDAMDAFALGGYRSAFDLLRSLDGELLQAESRLAQIEFTIINALSTPVEEQTPESGDTTEPEPNTTPPATGETEGVTGNPEL